MESFVELINVQAQNIFFSLISKANHYSLILKRQSFKSGVGMKSEFYDDKQNNFLELIRHQLCSEFTIKIVSTRRIFSLLHLRLHKIFYRESLDSLFMC
jgi:hypothetical protein